MLSLTKPNGFTAPKDLRPDETRWAWYDYTGPEVVSQDGKRRSRPVKEIGWARGTLNLYAAGGRR